MQIGQVLLADFLRGEPAATVIVAFVNPLSCMCGRSLVPLTTTGTHARAHTTHNAHMYNTHNTYTQHTQTNTHPPRMHVQGHNLPALHGARAQLYVGQRDLRAQLIQLGFVSASSTRSPHACPARVTELPPPPCFAGRGSVNKRQTNVAVSEI
jgi:hypothetical protein